MLRGVPRSGPVAPWRYAAVREGLGAGGARRRACGATTMSSGLSLLSRGPRAAVPIPVVPVGSRAPAQVCAGMHRGQSGDAAG